MTGVCITPQAILETWLTAVSPLADFEVRGETLCFRDLAVHSGVLGAPRYAARFYVGGFDAPTSVQPRLPVLAGGAGLSCVPLKLEVRPATRASGAPDDSAARYFVVDLLHEVEPSDAPIPPARLHFYDLGPARGYALVGVERPEDLAAEVR